MSRYIVRRVLSGIVSILAVFTITFLLMHATPGGPWDAKSNKPLAPEVIQAIKVKYHLDQPLWRQYADYLWDIVRHGDLGPSYTAAMGETVRDIIVRFWPVSIQLGAVAMALAILMGVPLGIISALKHNTWIDFLATFIAVIGISVPSFVLASLLVLIFALGLHLVPTGGWNGLLSKTTLVPAFALALDPAAVLARYTRSSMLEILSADYLRTARAKGLLEKAVIGRHALRNALIPVVTVAGLSLADVLTGSFFVETVYRVPGIGRYFVYSVGGRDYPVIIGVTLLYAVMLTGMNLVVDIAYGFLDPRIRYE